MPVENGFKPKIALIIDVEGWAFSNRANQIVNYLSDFFDFKIFQLKNYPRIPDIFDDLQGFDIVHFFYREAVFSLFYPYTLNAFKRSGRDYRNFILSTISKLALTTSINDHAFLSENEIRDRSLLFNNLFICYGVASQHLFELYSKIQSYPPPAMILHGGVCLNKFKPVNLDRIRETNRELVIGWSGNSKWNPNNDGRDYKGLDTIIKPAISELKAENYPVRLEYIDRNEKWVPFDSMPAYYNSIDVYVCASAIEGTPNPVLESMACGLPVISTDVGVVREVFGSKQKEFIIERNVSSLKEKIRLLVDHPEKRVELSNENLISIQSWSWPNKILQYKEFFNKALNLKKDLETVHEYTWFDRRKSNIELLCEIAESQTSIQRLETQIQTMSPIIEEYNRLMASKAYRFVIFLQKIRANLIKSFFYK